MKNYFTHSGKQESREVTITDLDMGTFDYFCTPLSLGNMLGCRGRAVQQKIGERCRGATPLSLRKMQWQGSAAKNWRALPLGGYPAIFGKTAGQNCRGKAVQ